MVVVVVVVVVMVVVVAVVVVVVVVIVGSVRMRLRGRGSIRRDRVTFLLLHLMVLRLCGVGRVRRSRVRSCWHWVELGLRLRHHEVVAAVEWKRGVLAWNRRGSGLRFACVVAPAVHWAVPDSNILGDGEALGEVGFVDGSGAYVAVVHVEPTIDQLLV
jgi:hypothetical protein